MSNKTIMLYLLVLAICVGVIAGISISNVAKEEIAKERVSLEQQERKFAVCDSLGGSYVTLLSVGRDTVHASGCYRVTIEPLRGP
jgi:hypothetical protein